MYPICNVVRKMVNTSPKVSNISKMLCFAVYYKEAQEVLDTQRGSPVARGVKRADCTLVAWFSWCMQCELTEGGWEIGK